MKQTVETLRAAGWQGYTKNKVSGNISIARHVLDGIAWTINNKPDRIKITFDNIRKVARLHIENECWVPEKSCEEYAERDMNEKEIAEVERKNNEREKNNTKIHTND